MLKTLLKYITIFMSLLIVLLTIFTITVKCIPRSIIEENIEKSIPQLKSNTELKEIKPRRPYSYLHVYADEILLNMIYCMDSDAPLKSIMLDAYYEHKYMDNDGKPSLKEAIENNGYGNEQYIRYWHGSMLIIRPLLIYLDIKQIYYLLAGIILILSIILIGILIRKKQILLTLATIIGYIMIAIIYVPFCLEYVWNFLIMLLVSIATILSKKRNIIFFISGMLTCFFDFLSTEIITLFIPIIYIYTIRNKNGEVKNFKKEIKQILIWIMLWSIGYIGMWCAKWVLASIILKTNALDYVLDKAMIRINGKIDNYPWLYVVIEAIFSNIKTIYPFFIFKNEGTVICIIIGIILITAILIKKDRKTIINLLIYLSISITPYIRYIILSNHSYRHYIFTFREQLITIMALIIGIYTSIDKDRIKQELDTIIKNHKNNK